MALGIFLDEGVTKQSLGFRAMGWVCVETVLHKRVKLRAPAVRLLESLDRPVFKLPHGDEGLEMGVGYYSFSQFYGSYPQGPNISFVGVLAVLHDFRTHPVRGPDLGFMSGVGIHAFGGHSKVS